MQQHKRDFLDLAFEYGALALGEFTLKSGRTSPYFFNLGAIAGGDGMRRLAACYADALVASGIQCEALFGPAYKGIPLVTALACALAERGTDLPFAYNRKEAKNHGEGGHLVGAPLSGRVAIVDDVITAGTAVREALGLIRNAGAVPAALLVALDRQERADGAQSAIQMLASEHGVTTVAVATLDDLLAYLQQYPPEDERHLERIIAYRAEYGVESRQ